MDGRQTRASVAAIGHQTRSGKRTLATGTLPGRRRRVSKEFIVKPPDVITKPKVKTSRNLSTASTSKRPDKRSEIGKEAEQMEESKSQSLDDYVMDKPTENIEPVCNTSDQVDNTQLVNTKDLAILEGAQLKPPKEDQDIHDPNVEFRSSGGTEIEVLDPATTLLHKSKDVDNGEITSSPMDVSSQTLETENTASFEMRTDQEQVSEIKIQHGSGKDTVQDSTLQSLEHVATGLSMSSSSQAKNEEILSETTGVENSGDNEQELADGPSQMEVDQTAATAEPNEDNQYNDASIEQAVKSLSDGPSGSKERLHYGKVETLDKDGYYNECHICGKAFLNISDVSKYFHIQCINCYFVLLLQGKKTLL